MSSNMSDLSCPKCGGAVWDNRETKRSPKAPDYKCQNRNCDGVIWPPRDQARGGNKSSAQPRPQQYPWGPLLKLCVQYTQKEIAPLFTNPTNEMVKEMAISLFITASNQRGEIFKKAAPAPQPPAPPPPPPPVAEYDDSDGGLPF